MKSFQTKLDFAEKLELMAVNNKNPRSIYLPDGVNSTDCG